MSDSHVAAVSEPQLAATDHAAADLAALARQLGQRLQASTAAAGRPATIQTLPPAGATPAQMSSARVSMSASLRRQGVKGVLATEPPTNMDASALAMRRHIPSHALVKFDENYQSAGHSAPAVDAAPTKPTPPVPVAAAEPPFAEKLRARVAEMKKAPRAAAPAPAATAAPAIASEPTDALMGMTHQAAGAIFEAARGRPPRDRAEIETALAAGARRAAGMRMSFERGPIVPGIAAGCVDLS